MNNHGVQFYHLINLNIIIISLSAAHVKWYLFSHRFSMDTDERVLVNVDEDIFFRMEPPQLSAEGEDGGQSPQLVRQGQVTSATGAHLLEDGNSSVVASPQFTQVARQYVADVGPQPNHAGQQRVPAHAQLNHVIQQAAPVVASPHYVAQQLAPVTAQQQQFAPAIGQQQNLCQPTLAAASSIQPTLVTANSMAMQQPSVLHNGGGDFGAKRQMKFLVKPQTFDGTSDLPEYLCHFEACADINGWDGPDKCRVFGAYLLGAARTYYLGLGERKKYDFDYLVDSLKRRFASQNLSASWRSRLQSRKRKVGECIRQLGDDLWKMAVRGHPGLDLAQPENEWILLEAFYNAIESENSVECIRCDCRNMHDAIDVVERYETSKTRGQAVNVRAITNPAPNQAPAQPFVPHTPAETPAASAVPVNSHLYMEKLMQVVTELSAGQQRLESQVSQQQVAGRSYSSDRRSNYNNGGDRRSFYGKGGDRSNTHPNRGAQGNTRPAVVYYNCKQQGHYQRECVNPPQQA